MAKRLCYREVRGKQRRHCRRRRSRPPGAAQLTSLALGNLNSEHASTTLRAAAASISGPLLIAAALWRA